MNQPITISRPSLLNTVELAKRLGISSAEVSRMCRAGLIWPVERIGGRWLIRLNYVVDVKAIEKERTPWGGRFINVPGAIGRPPGSKNRKPYPKGVKRPRKRT